MFKILYTAILTAIPQYKEGFPLKIAYRLATTIFRLLLNLH